MAVKKTPEAREIKRGRLYDLRSQEQELMGVGHIGLKDGKETITFLQGHGDQIFIRQSNGQVIKTSPTELNEIMRILNSMRKTDHAIS